MLDKVIVCIGVGGARSYLENMARSGFRNFILIDSDRVSLSNIATQAVYLSEVGMPKVTVIKERLMDINPEVTIVSVEKMLDDEMSDEEFKGYLDRFEGKQSTDYLILGCTDNFESQSRSAYLALKYACPYLAAMIYEEGVAGEIIFTYPGVTASCPRCLLRPRFEKYESGNMNQVTSQSCPIYTTERINALKGYISLMLLLYGEGEGRFSKMLDEVKQQNFVEVRLHPHLSETTVGITLFDRIFADVSGYTYFDETLWIPQKPDSIGSAEVCRLCGGVGDLRSLVLRLSSVDTRTIARGGYLSKEYLETLKGR